MSITKRPGKFSIDAGLIGSDPEVIMMVMSQCVIVRCEHMLVSNNLEYHAFSPHFDEVEEGTETPVYNIEAEQNGDDTSLSFVRVQ